MNVVSILFLLALLLLFLVMLGAAILVIWLIARAIRPDSTQHQPLPPQDVRVITALKSEHTRMWVSLLAALLVGLFVMWPVVNYLGLGNDDTSPYSFPDLMAILPWLGLGAGFAGLAIHILWRPARPVASDDIREADLSERTAWGFGPRWAFAIPLVTSGVLIAVLVAAGLASTQDAAGKWRRLAVTVADGGTADDNGIITEIHRSTILIPFPGWYYGAPLIVGVILLTSMTFWALHRTAVGPRIPGASTQLDYAVRTINTRFLMALSSAALGFAIAFLTSAAGTSLTMYAQEPLVRVGAQLDPMHLVLVQPWAGIGVVLNGFSVVAGIVSLWLLFVAARSIVSMRRLR